MSTDSTLTEAEILAEMVAPEEADYPRELAEALVQLRFSPKVVERLHELAARNRQGSLTEPERLLMEKYQRMGNLLNLLQAKARLSLKNSAS